MPRPRSLTPAAIAGAGLAVIDRDGLDTLSMRTVAAELGMGTMSLYRYVDDRAQLEGLIVEQVLSEVDLSVPSRASWRRRVTLLLERLRDAVGAHPAVVPLLLRHRHAVPASLRWIEAMLDALTRAGFAGRQRALAQRTVVAYLLGALQNEHYSSLGGQGTAAMAVLPPEEYPLLSETAGDAARIPAREEFRHGLDVVLRGLEAGLVTPSG